jgi:hypothetical protein
MSILLLAIALAAPISPDSEGARPAERVTCSVDVRALDAQGQPRSARLVSASIAPAVVFRGRLSLHEREMEDEATLATLLFDVFNPRGQRYQVLVAEPRVVVSARDGHRVKKVSKTREAALAVAGSSIAWTSMYGKWRVEPRVEGTSRRCGAPEYFTIRP